MSTGRGPRRRTIDVDVAVLCVDSSGDGTTRAAMEFREREVYPYLEEQGFKLLKRQGPLARREYVAPLAREAGVDYITGVGHGVSDAYTGDQGAAIFRVGDYSPEESGGKIVHLFSCHTARRLGPDFVRHGCRAYFGYDGLVTVPPGYAGVLFECDSEIDKAFADGLSAAEVYGRAVGRYNERIREFRAAGRVYAAAALELDRDHLRAPSSGREWGDQAAKLE